MFCFGRGEGLWHNVSGWHYRGFIFNHNCSFWFHWLHKVWTMFWVWEIIMTTLVRGQDNVLNQFHQNHYNFFVLFFFLCVRILTQRKSCVWHLTFSFFFRMSIQLKCLKNNFNFEWPVETIPHYSEESFRKYKETFKGGFPRALEKKNIKKLGNPTN